MNFDPRRSVDVFITACLEAIHECDNTVINGGVIQLVTARKKIRFAMNRRDEKIREATRLYEQYENSKYENSRREQI
jgi:hypothetical protein